MAKIRVVPSSVENSVHTYGSYVDCKAQYIWMGRKRTYIQYDCMSERSRSSASMLKVCLQMRYNIGCKD